MWHFSEVLWLSSTLQRPLSKPRSATNHEVPFRFTRFKITTPLPLIPPYRRSETLVWGRSRWSDRPQHLRLLHEKVVDALGHCQSWGWRRLATATLQTDSAGNDDCVVSGEESEYDAGGAYCDVGGGGDNSNRWRVGWSDTVVVV